MCWPRFDSQFIFGGLLDNKKGGEFSIMPLGEFASKQYYRENTNVLCTEITSAHGSHELRILPRGSAKTAGTISR